MPAMHYLRKIEELMEKIAAQQSNNSPSEDLGEAELSAFSLGSGYPLCLPPQNWEEVFGPITT